MLSAELVDDGVGFAYVGIFKASGNSSFKI
jgi:hypothetical protein